MKQIKGKTGGALFQWPADLTGLIFFVLIILMFFILFGPQGCQAKPDMQRISSNVTMEPVNAMELVTLMRMPIELTSADGTPYWDELSEIIMDGYLSPDRYTLLEESLSEWTTKQLKASKVLRITYPTDPGSTEPRIIVSADIPLKAKPIQKMSLPTQDAKTILVELIVPTGKLRALLSTSYNNNLGQKIITPDGKVWLYWGRGNKAKNSEYEKAYWTSETLCKGNAKRRAIGAERLWCEEHENEQEALTFMQQMIQNGKMISTQDLTNQYYGGEIAESMEEPEQYT